MKNRSALILFGISLVYYGSSFCMEATNAQMKAWRTDLTTINQDLNNLQQLRYILNTLNAVHQQEAVERINHIIDVLDQIKQAASVYSAKTCHRCTKLSNNAQTLLNNLLNPTPVHLIQNLFG